MKEVKLRTGFFVGKLSSPYFMKDAQGRDIKIETYPLFAALVWVIAPQVLWLNATGPFGVRSTLMQGGAVS